MKIFLIFSFVMLSFPLYALFLAEPYEFVTEGKVTHIFEKGNDGKPSEVKFNNKEEFYRLLMTDPVFKASLKNYYKQDIYQLFKNYFKNHPDGPIILYADQLENRDKKSSATMKLGISNSGIKSDSFLSALPSLTNKNFLLGPNKEISEYKNCYVTIASEFKDETVENLEGLEQKSSLPCMSFANEDEKNKLIIILLNLKKLAEKESTGENEVEASKKLTEIDLSIKDLTSSNYCSERLKLLKKELEIIKSEELPYNPSVEGRPFKDYSDNLIDCEEKTFFGAPCYTQRRSCISTDEKKRFTEKDVWLFPRDEETAFQLKIPILYQDAGKMNQINVTHNYKYGENFNKIISITSREIPFVLISSIILQEAENSNDRPLKVTRSIPKYVIDTRSSKFPLAEYPFFRPEDQCSVPKVNTQGIGGVCYQLACREHDYCFQSLPLNGGISANDLKEHFDFCNTKFKENLFSLCSTTGSFLKKMGCYLGAEVFYVGVEYGSRIIGGKDGMGKDFLKSQLDQANYLAMIYDRYFKAYCLSKLDLNNNKNCLSIKKIMEKIDQLKKDTEIKQDESFN